MFNRCDITSAIFAPFTHPNLPSEWIQLEITCPVCITWTTSDFNFLLFFEYVSGCRVLGLWGLETSSYFCKDFFPWRRMNVLSWCVHKWSRVKYSRCTSSSWWLSNSQWANRNLTGHSGDSLPNQKWLRLKIKLMWYSFFCSADPLFLSPFIHLMLG